MSVIEDETHMAMWCVMAAPLIVGCDLTKMSADTVRILTAPGALEVDQDPLGVQGTVCWASQDGSKSLQVWRKPLSDGSVAVVALNRNGPDGSAIDIPLAECGHGGSESEAAMTTVIDVWTGKVLANVSSGVAFYRSAALPEHGHAFLKISKQSVDVSKGSRREHTRCMQSNSAVERMALACPAGARISSLASWWGAKATQGACLAEDGATIVGGASDRTAWISDGCLGRQACSFEASEKALGPATLVAPMDARLFVRFLCEQTH